MASKPIRKRTKLPSIAESVAHRPVSPPPGHTSVGGTDPGQVPTSSSLDEEEKEELRQAFGVPGDDLSDGYISPQYAGHPAPEEREGEPSVTPEAPPDVTLGDLQAQHGHRERQSSVIASQFSDVPLPPPDLTVPPVPRPAPEVFRAPVPPPVAPLPDWVALGKIGREVTEKVAPPTPKGRYVARIEILDTFQYAGTLTGAPDWIDRNWTAYADQDETRTPPLPGGPALMVPGAGLCRRGWYVVREAVTVEDGIVSERLAVYEPDVFYHWFRPA